jgi:hypothetical protein
MDTATTVASTKISKKYHLINNKTMVEKGNSEQRELQEKAQGPVFFTPSEMLHRGLLAVGFQEHQIKRVVPRKNLSRFRTSYVSHPRVYSDLFLRLQTTEVNGSQLLDCSVWGAEKTLNYFFMAIHLLAKYPAENDAERIFSFHPCGKTFSTHAWDLVRKIASLSPEVIVWPDSWRNPDKPEAGDTHFIITVDGTHCPIEEPTLPSFKEQRKFYSHKFESAGLDYEVALSIFEPKCVLIAGPYPAGKNDITIFRKRLREKMMEARENGSIEYRAIADRGYRGEPKMTSVPTLWIQKKLELSKAEHCLDKKLSMPG